MTRTQVEKVAVKRTTVRAVNWTPDAPFDPSVDVNGEVFDGMADAPAFDEEASESDLQ